MEICDHNSHIFLQEIDRKYGAYFQWKYEAAHPVHGCQNAVQNITPYECFPSPKMITKMIPFERYKVFQNDTYSKLYSYCTLSGC